MSAVSSDPFELKFEKTLQKGENSNKHNWYEGL